MSVGLKWKLVLKSHHALKKHCIHGKLEFIMQLKASYPHFRIWALFFLSIPSFASIISAQLSSSLSIAYLLIQEIFKDLKKFRASIKLKPPSAFEPYKMIFHEFSGNIFYSLRRAFPIYCQFEIQAR